MDIIQILIVRILRYTMLLHTSFDSSLLFEEERESIGDESRNLVMYAETMPLPL